MLKFELGLWLVLGWVSAPGAPPIMTWTFVLEERSDGSTRLIVRARGERGYAFYGLPPKSGLTFVRLAHFIMLRKQLLGIASRAESPQRIENHDMPTEAA